MSGHQGVRPHSHSAGGLNRELAEAQARLTERNARLDNLQKNVLLGMAAHDLRNRFLLSKPDEVGPQAQRCISNIEASTTFMLALVEDLLDVSALESGQLNLSTEVADVRGLLQNAVELMRPLAQDKQIELPTSEQSLLFQPFGRTSARSTGGEKSTGPGLAIARRIVEGHHGNLGVISQPGEGSTFWFSLPVATTRPS